MSKCIINVGATGTGKTTEVVKILESLSRPIYIFDFQNDKKYIPFKNLWQKGNFKITEFILNTLNKKGSVFVFEEATIFFKHTAKKKELQEAMDILLVGKRHNDNIIIFNFHSYRKVPLELLDFCDLFICGYTSDTILQIEKKFDADSDIFKAFKEIINSKNIYEKRYVELNFSVSEN